MRKNKQVSFHSSDLGRAKPKRHFLKTFVDSNLKQPRRLHSDTGLVVDRTSPATVLRIIFGLIIVHLLVIGGVMLRGNIAKSNSGLAVAPTITPPPTEPAQATPAPAPAPAPAPVQPVAQAEPAQPAAQEAQVHITQPPVNMEAVTPAPAQPAEPAQPVAVQQPAPAPQPQGTHMKPYHVKSGDTWGRIAAQFNTTEDVLKGANPQLAAVTNLPGGTYLNVPVPEDAAAAQPQVSEQAQAQVQETVKFHEVKRGENLGRIARKYNIPLNKLLKMNNMTMTDAKRLKIGQKLKVSE